MTVILETDRLRLRELVESDAQNLLRLSSNPNVYQYTGDGPLADEAAALELLRTRIFPEYREFGVGRWAVERKDDGAFLGWCGLKWMADRGYYDLGYRFFEDQWGKGYATEAAHACLEWARSRFPGAHILGKSRVENPASIRVLEKLGLQFVTEEHDSAGRVAVYAWVEKTPAASV